MVELETYVVNTEVSSGSHRRSARDRFVHRNIQSPMFADLVTGIHSTRNGWEYFCPKGQQERRVESPTF